jgi:iron complex outermembrane receptor protein
MNETIKMPKFVNFSKVRVSWADVGRPGPRYFSNVNYGVSQSGESYILTPPADMPPTDADGKPNLKPERKREYEIGFEGYFFKDQRIGVDFSLYTNSIYDQIMKVKAPADMIGVDNIRINAGEVSNTGWELLIKTKPVLTKDFAWNLNLTFASSKTKIEELGADLKSMNLWGRNGLNAIAEVGGEYGIITQAKGTMKFINPSDPNDPRNGKQIINDSGSALEYDSKSNRKVGKMLPDLTGGIFTSFEYKGFRLIANIDYSFGATFISETETYMMAAGVLDETLKYRDKAHGGIAYHLNSEDVKVAGEGATTFWDGVQLDGIRKDGSINQKVVSASDYYSGSYFSNGFFPEDRLYKSDYVALRNIALDYTLPKNIANMLMMNQITLSVFANNVAYLYKDAPNSVPESSNGTGWGASNYGTTALPSQRSFGCSAKIKF